VMALTAIITDIKLTLKNLFKKVIAFTSFFVIMLLQVNRVFCQILIRLADSETQVLKKQCTET